MVAARSLSTPPLQGTLGSSGLPLPSASHRPPGCAAGATAKPWDKGALGGKKGAEPRPAETHPNTRVAITSTCSERAPSWARPTAGRAHRYACAGDTKSCRRQM